MPRVIATIASLCLAALALAGPALAAAVLTSPFAVAQGKDIRIAHIYSRTGPLEAYGKQTATGPMPVS